jgi:hypothetical protein
LFSIVWGLATVFNVFGSKQENRPVMDILINDTIISTLFDSGASCSILSWRKYLEINRRPTLNPTNLTLTTASGHSLVVKGVARMELKLGKTTIMREMAVVQGLRSDCIVGTDLMAEEGISIDPRRKKIRIEKSEPIDICAVRNYTIMAGEERLVQCVSQSKIKTREILVEEILDVLPNDAAVMSAVYKPTEDGRLALLITNAGREAFKLSRKDVIAQGHPFSRMQDGKIEHMVDALDTRSGVNSIDLNSVNLSNIPTPYHDKFSQLLRKFSDIFSSSDVDVGCSTVIEQEIELRDPSKVVAIPAYRLAHHLRPVAEQYVTKLLAHGIVQKSKSPFSSPLLLVRKAKPADPNDVCTAWRVVSDFRLLNDNTVKDSYPLHNLYDLIDRVSSAKIHSIVDLSQGFWNQSLCSSSRPFTAFSVPGMGHFEWTRSPQGLINSSATFQRLLDYVTRGLENTLCYIDDVIVSDRNYDEHLVSLERLFLRLRKYKIKCKLSKLQLGAREVDYLGYNISHDHGIRPGEVKTAAIKAWQSPRDITQIKQFIGLTSFFRRVIQNYSQLSAPLTNLTRKDSGYSCGPLPPQAEIAFQTLKEKLSSRPCLKSVDFDHEFILTVDGSAKNGFGAILSQNKKGIEAPVAYASRSITDTQSRYSSTHLEFAAILWACRHFKCYLNGKHFTIRTDHLPLTSLNKTSGPALDRIRTELDEYLPYTIVYISGKTGMMAADGLSRNPVPPPTNEETKRGRLYEIDNSLKDWKSVISWEQVRQLQKEDLGIKAIMCKLLFNMWPENQTLYDICKLWYEKCYIKSGVICLKTRTLDDAKLTNQVRAMAPLSIRSTLIELAHDHPLAGHFATEKTLLRLKSHWFWPNMNQEVEKHCKACKICLETNAPLAYGNAPLEPLPTALYFAHRVHADLLGPMPLDQGHKYLLALVDAYSGHSTMIPIPDKKAETVANAFFEKFCCIHGMVNMLVTDQGTEFKNSIMTDLCKNLHITQRFSSASHPQSNGKIERLNRKIISYLRKYLGKSNEWVNLVPPLQLSMNSAVHSSTNYTPHFLAFFRKPLLPTSVLEPKFSYSEDCNQARFALFQRIAHDVTKAENEAFQRQKIEFDKRARIQRFELGDMVMSTRAKQGTQFQKFQKGWEGPYEIIQLLGHNNILLKRLGARKSIIRHSNRLKAAPFLQQLYTQTNIANPAAPIATPLPLPTQIRLETGRRGNNINLRGFVAPPAENLNDDDEGNRDEIDDNDYLPFTTPPSSPHVPSPELERSPSPPAPPTPPAQPAQAPQPPLLPGKGERPPILPMRDRFNREAREREREREEPVQPDLGKHDQPVPAHPARTSRSQTAKGGPAPTEHPLVSETHKRRTKK